MSLFHCIVLRSSIQRDDAEHCTLSNRCTVKPGRSSLLTDVERRYGRKITAQSIAHRRSWLRMRYIKCLRSCGTVRDLTSSRKHVTNLLHSLSKEDKVELNETACVVECVRRHDSYKAEAAAQLAYKPSSDCPRGRTR